MSGGANSPKRKLAEADPSACAKWVPSPEGGLVRIVNMYDGDTLTALCVLASKVWKISLRLRGIDCPEMRGRGAAEKRAALSVRDVVSARALDQICYITAHGVDKYGRLIADVHLPDGCNLALLLLENGLGRPYAGETRTPFTAEEIQSIIANAANLQVL